MKRFSDIRLVDLIGWLMPAHWLMLEIFSRGHKTHEPKVNKWETLPEEKIWAKIKEIKRVKWKGGGGGRRKKKTVEKSSEQNKEWKGREKNDKRKETEEPIPMTNSEIKRGMAGSRSMASGYRVRAQQPHTFPDTKEGTVETDAAQLFRNHTMWAWTPVHESYVQVTFVSKSVSLLVRQSNSTCLLTDE